MLMHTTRFRSSEFTSGPWPSNTEFELEFRLPDSPGPHALLVAVHGFLETRDEFYRQQLADACLRRGIATVMLPLPFHFKRAKEVSALDRLLQDGANLIHGFRQLGSDLDALLECVATGKDGYQQFDPDRIALFGYSVGGAAVLALLRGRLRTRAEGTIKAAVIALAGVNLARVDPSELSVPMTQSDWAKRMAEATAAIDPQKEDLVGEVLNGVTGPGALARLLEELWTKVLLVQGGRDSVFPPETAPDWDPAHGLDAGKRPAVFQVPMRHPLRGDVPHVRDVAELTAAFVANRLT